MSADAAIAGLGSDIGNWGVLIAVLGGALRVSTPFVFVSLGECLIEKSGRVNLGLEGTLVLGAMTGYGVSFLTGSPWLGVIAAGLVGSALGAIHALLCARPRVNDIAVGIALMLLGIGLAFFIGKPLIKPTAPRLPAWDFGFWTQMAALKSALQVNALLPLGVLAAFALNWVLEKTRWGLTVRIVGESADSARALGYNVARVRLFATMAGGFLAGVGGSHLSLFYPGSWNEGLSSGQGLMAVALVIFSGWKPLRCLGASFLFAGASAISPALQSIGITSGYYLFGATPYVLTLLIMLVTNSATRTLPGQPAELSAAR